MEDQIVKSFEVIKEDCIANPDNIKCYMAALTDLLIDNLDNIDQSKLEEILDFISLDYKEITEAILTRIEQIVLSKEAM